MLSGMPGGEDELKLLPKRLREVEDIPTLWVTEACAELGRSWTNQFRPAQAGDVRETARRLWAAHRRTEADEDMRRAISDESRQATARVDFRSLIGAMREAAGRFAELSPEQQQARRDAWLEDDVARRRISRRAAAAIRRARAAG